MAKQPREKEPANIVHQNAILCETIRKEVRNQKLYTNYSVNPFKKSKPRFRLTWWDQCACTNNV